MTTTKAIRLASVVTAIDVLIASGFSIVGIIRPQYLLPAGSVPTQASLILAMYAADVSAAGVPVAYLTAHMTLARAGFQAGKTVLAPAIGGSVGNATTQLALALGFNEVIDTSSESLTDGVRRITDGYGADIVIDALGGKILSEALGALALAGSLTTLGYSASREATIDVTNLIWRRASIQSFSLFAQPQAAFTEAWNAIVSLLQSGGIKPVIAKTFPLDEAPDALRHLIEGRPFGKVILAVSRPA